MLIATALMLLLKASRSRALVVASCVRTCTAAHLHCGARVVTRVAGGERGGGTVEEEAEGEEEAEIEGEEKEAEEEGEEWNRLASVTLTRLTQTSVCSDVVWG